MKKEMFYAATAPIFNNARVLRSQPTAAESILWMHLRTRPQGYKFRRQHPVANYILNFYCHALKLAIEADGPIHSNPAVVQADIERQNYLEAQGIQFIRVTNEEVLLRLETVIEKVNSFMDSIISNKKANV